MAGRGSVFQTVWNVLDGRNPTAGISDYDVFYFDASDLSWDAEDAVVKRAADLFGDLDVAIEIRNEARVPSGAIDAYAPHGYGDLFNRRVRPNPRLAPRDVYERKAARWLRE